MQTNDKFKKKAESYRAEIVFICIPQVCSTPGRRCMDKFKLCFNLFILLCFLESIIILNIYVKNFNIVTDTVHQYFARRFKQLLKKPNICDTISR